MQSSGDKLVKIGDLARLFKVLPSTINYYTNQGLLPEATRTRGGYRLYSQQTALKRLFLITKLQNDKRLTIEEIKKSLR